MRPTTAKVTKAARGISMQNSRKNMSAMRIETNLQLAPGPRNPINPMTLNETSEQFRYSRLSTHEEPVALGLMTKQHLPTHAFDPSNVYVLNSPSICNEVDEENLYTAKKKMTVRKSSNASQRAPLPMNHSGKNLRKMHKRNQNILGNRSMTSKNVDNSLLAQ
jgi:hypothetical protein